MKPHEKFLHIKRYRIAKKFGDKIRITRILDAGCGMGYGANILGAMGVDLDIEALRIAKSRYSHLDFVRADVHSLPFRKQSFDMIVSFEVIEHAIDVQRYTKEIYSCLRMHGLLFISTPNLIFQIIIKSLNKYPKSWGGHRQAFTYISFKKELQNAGFRVLDITGQLWFPKSFPRKLRFLSSVGGRFLVILSYVLIIMGQKNKK
ncbi:MAG: class I SAM-dependent methyltransferase [Candidatus Hodarchaeota archaeon]